MLQTTLKAVKTLFSECCVVLSIFLLRQIRQCGVNEIGVTEATGKKFGDKFVCAMLLHFLGQTGPRRVLLRAISLRSGRLVDFYRNSSSLSTMGRIQREASFAPASSSMFRHYSGGPRDDEDDLDLILGGYNEDEGDGGEEGLGTDFEDDNVGDNVGGDYGGDYDDLSLDDNEDDVVRRAMSPYDGDKSPYDGDEYPSSYASTSSQFTNIVSTISPSHLPLFSSEKYTSTIVSLSACYSADPEGFDVEDETLLNFLKVAMDRLHFNIETAFR